MNPWQRTTALIVLFPILRSIWGKGFMMCVHAVPIWVQKPMPLADWWTNVSRAVSGSVNSSGSGRRCSSTSEACIRGARITSASRRATKAKQEDGDENDAPRRRRVKEQDRGSAPYCCRGGPNETQPAGRVGHVETRGT